MFKRDNANNSSLHVSLVKNVIVEDVVARDANISVSDTSERLDINVT